MSRAEAQQRLTAVDVLEVVVGVRDAQLALILGTVVITVANERGLEVIVEVSIANSQVIRPMAEIRQPVVKVLVVRLIGAEIQVVEPDVSRGLHADGVAARVAGRHFADGQVADDHVFGVADEQPEACEPGGGVGAQEGLVAADADFGAAGDFAFDDNGGGGVVFDGGGEGGIGGYCDGFAAGSAGLG